MAGAIGAAVRAEDEKEGKRQGPNDCLPWRSQPDDDAQRACLAKQLLRVGAIGLAREGVHRDPEAIDGHTMESVDLVLDRPQPWESKDEKEAKKRREGSSQHRALEGGEHERRNGVLRPPADVEWI